MADLISPSLISALQRRNDLCGDGEGPEQRRSERQPTTIPCRLIPVDEETGRPDPRRAREAVAIDVSGTGVRVLARRPLEPGPVVVELDRGEAGTLSVASEIVRSSRLGMGISQLGIRFVAKTVEGAPISLPDKEAEPAGDAPDADESA